MRIVVFGLTISSSWGNGHATLWRGLCRSLYRHGHQVVFFERDLPFYAGARDQHEPDGCRLVIYPDWEAVRFDAAKESRSADVVMVTSYCPDALAATELALTSRRALRAFYDLDTPVTLARLSDGDAVPYVGARGLADFDLVLSYTGGAALDQLRTRLGARRVAPLYGHVDPAMHRPVAPEPHYRSDLSYLGTYSDDRQHKLDALLVAPAHLRLQQRFLIGGAQYPDNFPWSPNIYFVRHLPPAEHPAFFSSSRLTLNVTRQPMAELGWCPSGRLFEAAACGTPIVSDCWPGIEDFFKPGAEILTADNTDQALALFDLDDAELSRIARAARERVLTDHTSERRASELVALLEAASARRQPEMAEA